MAKWVNTVPQGVIGTGDATVFNNPVAAQFGNQLANLRQNEQRQALIRQRQAEEMAKSFRDNQLAASEGRLWADQVGKLEQDHIQKGIDLKQRGIDPYGSSTDALNYQKERRQVQSQQGYRKAQEAQYNAIIKGIQAKGIENYEPEDIAKLNEFVSNGNLSDAYSGNLQLPQVRERFSPNTLLKDIKAITQNDVDVKGNIKSDRKFLDKEATMKLIEGRLMSDPRGQQYLNKITNGIPVQQLMSIPKTVEANREDIIKEYNGNPQLRQKLATDAGVIGEGTPEFEKWVNEMAKVRASARNNFDNQMESFVANSANGVMLWDKNTPDYTEANQRRADATLSLRQQSEARQAANDSGGNSVVDAPQDVPLYYGGGDAMTMGKGMVKIPMSGKNFVSSTAIDLKTGKPEIIKDSSNDYEVVSVANYPILNRDITIQKKDNNGKVISTETLKKGALVQKEYADKHPNNVTEKPMIHVQQKGQGSNAKPKNKLVDYSYMPKGLTKPQEKALGQFIPSQQSAPSSKKSYSDAQEKVIKDNLKANPLYTREEIIKALGY